ncbi:MAG TPA: hypothetical protein ENO19_05605 [Halothiobacillaceae bacterium]|nr:hypothetical protein [Halothiobacillaceae bacterium]
MYTGVVIDQFRGIPHLEISGLERVNLVVGKNNVGKTTLLEALFLLVGGGNPQLPINTNAFRGLSVMTNDYWAAFFREMQISRDIQVVGHRSGLEDMAAVDELVIRPYLEKDSSIRGFSAEGYPIPITANGDSDFGASPIGLRFVYRLGHLKEEITSSIVLREGHLEAQPPRVKPENLRKGIFVNPSTRFDWKPRFDTVQRRKRHGKLVEFLRGIDSGIRDLRLNAVGLLEADIGFENALIPVNLLGGGIASALSVALAMLDADDGVVLIDEFETGLHHSIQQLLWKIVFEWAEDFRVQVFATTHSRETLQAFSQVGAGFLEGRGKVFRLERRDEGTTGVSIDREQLEVAMENQWEVR